MAIERAEVVEYIKNMSVMDLTELVKELEEELGVSAQAPVVQGVMPPPNYDEVPEVEEKTEFTVKLVAAGDKKIQTIKALREVNKGLGLKEAKTVVEEAPVDVLLEVPKEEAEAAKEKLEGAGATVEIV